MMIASIFMANAQQTFAKGDKVVNLGLGFGTYGVGSTIFPPLSASLDYGVKDRLFDNKSSLSVGGYAGYYGYKNEQRWRNEIYGIKTNIFVLGVRGALHYEFVKKLDTYVGALLGYGIASASFYENSPSETSEFRATAASGTEFSTFIGARYYFSPVFAAFAEIGYGLSALEFGVAIKL